MSQPIRRRFTLLDGMVLVAAVAFGLGVTRWYHKGRADWFQDGIQINFWIIPSYLAWMILPLTPALMFLRLRKPHPTRRRLIRQPGFQAGLAIWFAWFVWIINQGGVIYDNWRDGVPWVRLLDFEPDLHHRIAPFIVAIWGATWAVGRRKAEQGWIDRAGRGLGWLWIGVWLLIVADDDMGLFKRLRK